MEETKTEEVVQDRQCHPDAIALSDSTDDEYDFLLRRPGICLYI